METQAECSPILANLDPQSMKEVSDEVRIAIERLIMMMLRGTKKFKMFASHDEQSSESCFSFSLFSRVRHNAISHVSIPISFWPEACQAS